MAKWGEGDPRWIVEEREDAKNPNNWHWTEKNATSWSIKKIKSLLTDLKISNDKYEFFINEIDKCEGEAIANNRKGKLIFFYEWVIEAKWTAVLASDKNVKYTGKFEILNLSEENSADDINVEFSSEQSDNTMYDIKSFLHVEGTNAIRKSLDKYIKELKHEYGKDLILPTNKGKTNSANGGCPVNAKSQINNTVNSSTTSKSCSDFESINITEDFICSSEDLFRVFTDKSMIQAFSKAPANVDLRESGTYELWGGNITGKFIEISQETPQKLIFTWRRSNWPKDHFSKVTFKFESNQNGCRLHMVQDKIPIDEMENVRNGWSINYFNAIRATFGYGQNIVF